MSSINVYVLHASGAETASGQSAGVDVSFYTEALLFLDVTAASGTGPTLDVKLQTSVDNATWYDCGVSVAQQTGVARPAVVKATNLGRYLRAVWTVGGTTPSFTFSITLLPKVT